MVRQSLFGVAVAGIGAMFGFLMLRAATPDSPASSTETILAALSPLEPALGVALAVAAVGVLLKITGVTS